ncbi:hypothetical protein L3V82_10730 [Thiotrichales bacterium 19S3-7]|nr:hypothetical protein [Thiotrichales bacterium 19S3-7]MCF6802632.1 hypothetical protein [Thiotrichales bacterium 19S3-11]
MIKKISISIFTLIGLFNLSYAFSESDANNEISNKKFNIEWNVPYTLIGIASANANYKLNNASAIGVYGGISTWNSNKSAYNIGLQYSYALNKNYMSSGWLLKPFIGYMNLKDSDNSVSNGYNVGLMFTYQWVWKSGLNMQLGFGPSYTSINGGVFANTHGLLPAFEYNIGLSF